jgi:serine protease AprX
MAGSNNTKGFFDLGEDRLSRLIFETFGDQRYTQDSPIMPDVWLGFACAPQATQDLLLTPVGSDPPSKLATLLTERLAAYEEEEEEEVRLRRLDDVKMVTELATPTATGALSKRAKFNVAYSRSNVVAEVTFSQLICVIVPMTEWWSKLDAIARNYQQLRTQLTALADGHPTLSQIISESAIIVNRSTWDFFRFCALVGFIAEAQAAEIAAVEAKIEIHGKAYAQRKRKLEDMMEKLSTGETLLADVAKIIDGYGRTTSKIVRYEGPSGDEHLPRIFMVTQNRTASLSITESRNTVKADAANNLFKIETSDFAWAVIDGGVDAQHPAFLERQTTEKYIADERAAAEEEVTAKQVNAEKDVIASVGSVHPLEAAQTNATSYLRQEQADFEKIWRQDIPRELLPKLSRVRATYDFTYLRRMLALKDLPPPDDGGPPEVLADHIRKKYQTELNQLRIRTVKSGEIDWDMVAPLIRIPHDQKYIKPLVGHGTHVAAILGGHWLAKDNPENSDLIGICPQIRLFDLRVYNPKTGSDEFTVQYALQFVEHLNRNRDVPLIHGVNLSLSMLHKVMSFGCGRTPVCDECNRLVSTGVIVVVAAGNDGYKTFKTDKGNYAGYHAASITDPGNAEEVITVGATHRSHPHNYGVSYFSSRGPTGDGRQKPDLVAPGEKITAPILNCRVQRMDGTSMAAPHVSGAAALLMARHRELIGNPRRIKEILCRTATDLGREAQFQGAGMVDILRALQSI